MTQHVQRSTTIRIDLDLPLLEIGARSGLLWSREGLVLAGVGRALQIPIDRPGGFGPAAASLAAMAGDSELDAAGTGPLAFAALPFDPDQTGELIVPRVIIGANPQGQRWLTIIDDADAGSQSVFERAMAVIETVWSGSDSNLESGSEPTDYQLRSVLRPEQWRDEVVAVARDRIRHGDLDKTVLARELRLVTDEAISLPAVITRLNAVFPAAALFLVDGFVGASPELLVSRQGDVVRAHPLAGTAPRSTDPATDQRQLANLLASDKDRWEHRITIDWLLDTLLPFCSYVDAEPEPSIVTMANVHHLGTRVEGRLSTPAAPILELVAALHPTPAVGGSPQKDALALIAELEQAQRGRYAGPTGWVDGAGNGEFVVAIRSAEIGEQQATIFAGVGVVADSDPQAELDETRAKFKAMLGALIVP
ncbi:MAG: isochorismate synthase [Acidimicrobiales bacterium]